MKNSELRKELEAILAAYPIHLLADDATRKIVQERLKFIIKGSANQALFINTLTYFSGSGAVAFLSPMINSMTNLNGSLKNILVASTLVMSTLTYLPVGMIVDKNGGLALILSTRFISLVGQLGLITIAMLTDLSTIDSFDWRFALIALCSMLVGLSTLAFILVGNVAYWHPLKKAGFVQSLFSGIGNMALGLSALFLQLTFEALGVVGSLSLYAVFFLLTTVIAAKGMQAPPYHQLLALGIAPDDAQALAKIAGQEKLPNLDIKSAWRESLKTVLGLRPAALLINVVAAYGGFYATSIGFYITLRNRFNLPVNSAVVINAVGSLWSMLIRILASRVSDRIDKSGGVFIYIASALCIATAALMLAVPKPIPSIEYLVATTGILYTVFGIGSSSTLNLLVRWSKPNNPELSPYNIGAMSGWLGVIGGLSGVVLPSFVALLVATQGDDGYLNSFYLTAGVAILASILSGSAHYYTQHATTKICSHFFAVQRREVNSDEVVSGDSVGLLPLVDGRNTQ